MLQKFRDLGSIPDGLCRVAQDTAKGSAVIRKLVSGKEVLVLPSSKEEAAAFTGFVTLDIEYNEHKGSYYDVIPKDSLAVCYTKVKNNEWKTTEFVGELNVGDQCVIGFTKDTDAGKVRKINTGAGSGETATLEVVGKISAMAGYEKPMVIVRIL